MKNPNPNLNKAFNYNSLNGRMRELGYTQESLAAAAGMSLSQLSQKLNGHYPFKQTDIQNICVVLNICPADIGRYFFTLGVEKTQQKGG